ncbi:MAG TPA: helix-turn-helix transcriptional regulator, partial [Mycobacteriales bacterium]
MTGEDFGTALRRWRELRRLSVRELAALTHHGKSQISDLENGVRRPRPEVAAHLDRILQAGGALVTVAQREGAPRPHPAEFVPTLVLPLEGCDDAMYRRTFVLALGGLAGLGVSAPMLAVEAARHGLTPGLAERRAEAPVDEWHAIVREYGYRYQTTAPAELSDGLVVDLLGIGHAVERQRDEAVLRELYRAASLLAAVMAMSVSNIGHLPHAERWWRTARATAERSGSAETAAWVRG